MCPLKGGVPVETQLITRLTGRVYLTHILLNLVYNTSPSLTIFRGAGMSFLNLALTCQMMNWRTFQVVREMLIVACLLAFVMPSTHAARKSQHEIPIIAEPDTPHSRGIPGMFKVIQLYVINTK